MEINIQKAFFNKNYIFVVDDKDVLYVHYDTQFFPFLSHMPNIKNCIKVNKHFYVHHDRTISIFDKDTLILSKLPEDTWISRNIDAVCYDKTMNILVTLENGEIFVNFDVDQSDRIELNRAKKLITASDGNIFIKRDFNNYDDIKIVNNTVVAIKNDEMDIFKLKLNDIIYLRTIIVSKKMYNDIYYFNDITNRFVLKNGNKLSLSGKLFYTEDIINHHIYRQHQVFFLMKNDCLVCHYDISLYESVVAPLVFMLPILNVDTTKNDLDQCTMTICFPTNTNISIINGDESQIIMYDNKLYPIDFPSGAKMDDNDSPTIVLTDESIYYEDINSSLEDKTDTELIIDVNNFEPIVNQLINIIPSVYRLNSEMMYEFEQIDCNGNVISYGDGVTRHAFNMLRKELDDIFKNKFEKSDSLDPFKLGKLFYFCNNDGKETFFNIHPYFFYALSKKSDYLSLLKSFKGDSYVTYVKQYTQYINHPEILIEIDAGITNADEYIRFLMSSDLTEKQIKSYDSFIKGFCFLACRNQHYKLTKHLPVMYYIRRFIATGYFDASFDFYPKNDSVDKNQFTTFCDTFNQIFNNLSWLEKSYFVQNVTGSQYYSDTIEIIFAYEDSALNTIQTIHDANVIYDEDEPEPMQQQDIVIDLVSDKKLAYQISTCNTEISINIKPTVENITNLIKMLTVEDLTIKN